MVDYSAVPCCSTVQRSSLPKYLLQCCSKGRVIQTEKKTQSHFLNCPCTVICLVLPCRRFFHQQTVPKPGVTPFCQDHIFPLLLTSAMHAVVCRRAVFETGSLKPKRTRSSCVIYVFSAPGFVSGRRSVGDSKVDISGLSATTWFIVRLCRQSLRRPGTKDKV